MSPYDVSPYAVRPYAVSPYAVSRRAAGRVAAALTLVVLAGCTSGAGAQPGAAEPASVAAHAGGYPVATAPPQVGATPTVAAGGYQLVAAGVPVHAQLGPGSAALVTALGPDVALPPQGAGAPPSSAPGVLTVRVAADQGELAVSASQFVVLDEERRPVPLVGEPATSTAGPGRPGQLRLSAQFAAGHTTLTWQPLGRPLITWDFVVELD